MGHIKNVYLAMGHATFAKDEEQVNEIHELLNRQIQEETTKQEKLSEV